MVRETPLTILNLAQLSSHEIYWYGMILNMCFMSWIDICCAWKLQTSHSELSTCLAALCWARTCPKVGTPWYTMIHLYIAEKVRAMTTPSIYKRVFFRRYGTPIHNERQAILLVARHWYSTSPKHPGRRPKLLRMVTVWMPKVFELLHLVSVTGKLKGCIYK